MNIVLHSMNQQRIERASQAASKAVWAFFHNGNERATPASLLAGIGNHGWHRQNLQVKWSCNRRIVWRS